MFNDIILTILTNRYYRFSTDLYGKNRLVTLILIVSNRLYKIRYRVSFDGLNGVSRNVLGRLHQKLEKCRFKMRVNFCKIRT